VHVPPFSLYTSQFPPSDIVVPLCLASFSQHVPLQLVVLKASSLKVRVRLGVLTTSLWMKKKIGTTLDQNSREELNKATQTP
jgi:hypothetical protein